MSTEDKAIAISEQIANLFSETKYSTSLFSNNKKIGANQRLCDLKLGYSHQSQLESLDKKHTSIICLKGSEEEPKVFNRFRHVDSPERQLSYIADEEAYDAVSFFPEKDIKFAGFSVYMVHSNTEQDFKCFYKMKIGNENHPEKSEEFL